MKQETKTPATPVQPTTVGELPETLYVVNETSIAPDPKAPEIFIKEGDFYYKNDTPKIAAELVRRYNAFPAMLEFIKNEDNHTEGEQGNSCIDVATLINFINNL